MYFAYSPSDLCMLLLLEDKGEIGVYFGILVYFGTLMYVYMYICILRPALASQAESGASYTVSLAFLYISVYLYLFPIRFLSTQVILLLECCAFHFMIFVYPFVSRLLVY